MSSLFQDFTDFCNTEIGKFIESKRDDIVALGPEYSNFSPDESARNLRLYRMAKKFEAPSPSSNDRKNKSVKDMFTYDSEGIRNFDISMVPSGYLRFQLQNARYNLQRALRSFKLDLSEFDLPTGETSVSARGDVSIFAKLRDPSQWCVSPECFSDFAAIVYNSPGLKNAFRAHVKAYGKMRRHDGETGYDTFKRYLKAFVTFVAVSRVTTVPKNIDVDRVILCEPLGNMIVQRCIAKAIIKFINNHFDIDLVKSQEIHKAWLRDDNISTIDLSNASNSNWMAVVEFLLQDTPLLKHIKRARLEVVKFKEYYHHLNMMSPMGNGFTFEVMTLVLLAITREFDSQSHVFGDDIIVDTLVAVDVIELLESIGYKINRTKTFINSRFRESCGGFYNADYILSFDFWWSDDIVGAVTNVNKLFYMQQIDETYSQLWKELVEKAPVSLLGSYLYYTSWPVCPVNDKMHAIDYVNLTGNISLSSHIICHPRYQAKRIKGNDKDGKSTRLVTRTPMKVVLKSSTPYWRKTKSGKKQPWLPTKNIRGFLLSHYLYVGVVSPHFRQERILTERYNK